MAEAETVRREVYICNYISRGELHRFSLLRVLEQLNAFNGLKLFKMTKKDCIAAFGKEEGTRLFSQITISRNTADFKTARTSGIQYTTREYSVYARKLCLPQAARFDDYEHLAS